MNYPLTTTEWKNYVNGDPKYQFDEKLYKDSIRALLKEVQIGKEAEKVLEKLSYSIKFEMQ